MLLLSLDLLEFPESVWDKRFNRGKKYLQKNKNNTKLIYGQLVENISQELVLDGILM